MSNAKNIADAVRRSRICGGCHQPLDVDEQKALLLVFEAARDEYDRRVHPGSISTEAAHVACTTCPRCVLQGARAVYADRMARPRGVGAVMAARRALREALADQFTGHHREMP